MTLALKAFAWSTVNALHYYKKETLDEFPENSCNLTAEFLDNIRVLFEIWNVNHPKKGPITSMTCLKITKLWCIQQYLEEIVLPVGIPSKETKSALILTINATYIMVEKLLSFDVTNILTGNFQQDPIEEYFGAQRLRAGCSYRVTVQQFAETERKLCNNNIVTNRQSTNTFRGRASIGMKQPLLKRNQFPMYQRIHTKCQRWIK